MIVLTAGALALLGGTTWCALQQSVARDTVLNHRLTAIGLTLCAAVAVTLLLAVVSLR